MPALIIKPKDQSGNKLILQDQAGGAVLTTADSGATIANATLTAPTVADMSNCTFPAGMVIQVVNNTYTTGSNSSSFGDTIAKVEISSATNYKGTINNVGASNHVWVICSFQLRLESSSHNPGGEVVITRDTTNLWSGTDYDQYNYHSGTSTLTNVGTDNTITLSWMDESPATGTNIYYLSGRRYDANTTAYVKGGGFPFKMVLTEIQK